MSNGKHTLPLADDGVYLTDGGIETTLNFHEGIELPLFAAFVLLDRDDGIAALRRYYEPYVQLAIAANRGFIFESPTWRASRDWAGKLGYGDGDIADVNRRAIALMRSLADDVEDSGCPLLVSGCVGPRGDGYRVGERMTAGQARDYHRAQVAAFGDADLISAITMTYPEEAIGIARAAAEAGKPSVVSFTTETDGRLPSGDTLREAIETVDAGSDPAPAYYMINCAHPDHFDAALAPGEAWTGRIRGLRANASRLSHAELDEATELDSGDPAELGALYRALRQKLPGLAVFGGCCGTDHRHLQQIAQALA